MLQKKVYGPTKGIPECGTDAMRFGLCNYTAQGRNINLNVRVIVSYRHFCDKLWNIIRFAQLSIPEGFVPEEKVMEAAVEPIDQWILSTLAQHVKDANDNIPLYNFGRATESVIHWWRACLADVYLEAIKPRMKSDDAESKNRAAHVLYTCLDIGLKVLHPFMPFVTEELWQRLPRRKGDPLSIMICKYPDEKLTSQWKNAPLEAEFGWILDVCQKTRSAKACYNITRKMDPEITYVGSSEKNKAILESWAACICPLIYAGKISTKQKDVDELDNKGCVMQLVDDRCQLYMRLQGLSMNYGEELQKQRKICRQKTRQLESMEANVNSATFSKKPQEIKDKETAELAVLRKELEITQATLADFIRLMEQENLPIPEEVKTPEKKKKEKAPKKNNNNAEGGEQKKSKKQEKREKKEAAKKEQEKK